MRTRVLLLLLKRTRVSLCKGGAHACVHNNTRACLHEYRAFWRYIPRYFPHKQDPSNLVFTGEIAAVPCSLVCHDSAH